MSPAFKSAASAGHLWMTMLPPPRACGLAALMSSDGPRHVLTNRTSGALIPDFDPRGECGRCVVQYTMRPARQSVIVRGGDLISTDSKMSSMWPGRDEGDQLHRSRKRKALMRKLHSDLSLARSLQEDRLRTIIGVIIHRDLRSPLARSGGLERYRDGATAAARHGHRWRWAVVCLTEVTGICAGYLNAKVRDLQGPALLLVRTAVRGVLVLFTSTCQSPDCSARR